MGPVILPQGRIVTLGFLISRLFGWPFGSCTENSCPSLKMISSPSNLMFCVFSLDVKKKRFHLSNRGKKTKFKEERKKKKEVYPLLLFPSNASTSSLFNTLFCAVTCVLLLIPNLKDTPWPKTHTHHLKPEPSYHISPLHVHNHDIYMWSGIHPHVIIYIYKN